MRKASILILCILSLCFLSSCSTTQCNTAKKTLASAQVAYDAALASGNADRIDKYRWTLSAAQAVVDIWCVGYSTP